MNIIFDLDGTLLDTLEDIKDALNDALEETGFPLSYTYEGCKKLIGDGITMLMHRALAQFDNEENLEKLRESFWPRYLSYQGRKTHPYEGVISTLEAFSARGDNLFIASNKPDEMAQEIVKKTLPYHLFKRVAGHKQGDPVKPNPIQVERILRDFNLKKEDTIYVGDSITDVRTARNAGIRVCLCTYGYGAYSPDLLDAADVILKNLYNLEAVFSFQN